MKRVTVKDIADELGITVGTVSKALSGKSGVNKELRANIIRKADEMGYSVNRIAQSLARKTINIGIVYPAVWSEYYGKIIEGMSQALQTLRDRNVIGKFYTFSTLYATDELNESIKRLVEEKVDLVALCPASVVNFNGCLDNLTNAGIPLILVGNDIEGVNRLACIRVNAVMAGRLAAEFMNYITSAGAEIAVLIGDKGILEHREKVSAFEAGLEDKRRLRFAFETQDDPEVASFITIKILKDCPNVSGIYVATGNSLAVCKSLDEYDPEKKIKVIATDLFDEIIPYVKNRRINGIIFQDPIKLGKEAIIQGYNVLTEHNKPINDLKIQPSLILRSNII
jgi:Transcriptional regulators